MKEKVESLIGFAIRANKVVFGADNILKNKKIHLIICCKTLSENSFKKIMSVAGDKIPVILSQIPLSDITYKKGVKAIGITDKQMSKAILKYLTDNFILD